MDTEIETARLPINRTFNSLKHIGIFINVTQTHQKGGTVCDDFHKGLSL
jgi:hypothetical protein